MLRHTPRKTFYRGFASTATSLKPFTISYIIPDGRNQLETETYSSGKEFRLAFPGFRFVDPKTNVAISATSIPDKVDPTVTYLAKHPFFVARLEGYSHQQVSDKAFEEKSCAALERHLRKSHTIHRRPPHNPSRVDGWRFLGGDKDVAEWEGIWEGVDGHVYFLEAKHSVDMVKLALVRQKAERSIAFLGVDRANAGVYIAGNYWTNEAKEEIRAFYKFGMLTNNGQDLEVHEPVMT